MLQLYSMKSSVSYTAVSYASVSNMVLKTWFQWLLLASLLLSDIALGQRRVDPALIEEYCKNFTHGSPNLAQFYSPMYPRAYPEDINCFKTITAEFGSFVRIDFRDMFRIEPANNEGSCEYDYLEIRDGDQGYAPLIGKYCGDKFPPIITSSGRSLWLRFSSDKTISYTGFKAVYTYIPNPLGNLPDIGKCEFETGGFQGFISSTNITQDRRDHTISYDTPIDCVWTIRAEMGFQIYIQFTEYELQHPNDCHTNYIQVFDGKTDTENMVKIFCGSVAESVTSTTNVVYVRFYSEKNGLESRFDSIFTAMRALDSGVIADSCDPETEYDCDDATCIHPSLVCNDIRNCKFGWDEEGCTDPGASIALDFTSPHIIVILIILIIILVGMGTGMILNLFRTLREDKEELEDAETPEKAADPELPTVVPPQPRMKPPPTPGSGDDTNNGECYVPDGGFPFNSRF